MDKDKNQFRNHITKIYLNKEPINKINNLNSKVVNTTTTEEIDPGQMQQWTQFIE